MLKKLLPYFLILLYLIYMGQTYIPALKLLSSVSALLLVAISCYYFVRTWLINERHNMFIKSLTCLFVLFLIGFATSNDMNIATNMLKMFILVNFIFFPIYYLTRKRIIDIRFLEFTIWLFTAFFIFDYFSFKDHLIMERIADVDDVVNNAGYNLVCLIPGLLFMKKKYFMPLIMILSLLVVESAKRGAIITLFMGLIYIFIVYKRIYGINKLSILSKIALTVIPVVVLLLVWNYMSSNEYIMERFSSLGEGDSSGRDVLLVTCWNSFWENIGLGSLFFGYGLGATVNLAGNFAHNDWMETLVNLGFLGIFSLIAYYGGIFKEYRRINDIHKYILLLCLMMLFVRTVFSMSFADPSSFPLIIICAYIMGMHRKQLY